MLIEPSGNSVMGNSGDPFPWNQQMKQSGILLTGFVTYSFEAENK